MERLHQLLTIVPDLYRRGLLDASGGNLAVRSSRGVYVSPYQAGEQLRWQLDAEDFVLFPGGGEASMARAGRHPGRETRLHRAVLAARPDWNIVWHAHCWGLLSFAMAGVALPVPEHFAILLRPGKALSIPVAPDGEPASGLVERVVAELGQNFNGASHGAVLLAGHGPLVAGTEVDSTMCLVETLENLARAQQRLLLTPS